VFVAVNEEIGLNRNYRIAMKLIERHEKKIKEFSAKNVEDCIKPGSPFANDGAAS